MWHLLIPVGIIYLCSLIVAICLPFLAYSVFIVLVKEFKIAKRLIRSGTFHQIKGKLAVAVVVCGLCMTAYFSIVVVLANSFFQLIVGKA
jgi:hypothetical protein